MRKASKEEVFIALDLPVAKEKRFYGIDFKLKYWKYAPLRLLSLAVRRMA